MKLRETVAAVWLGAGIGAVGGMSIYTTASLHNEAIRADAIATVLEEQDAPQAGEWRGYADNQEAGRNAFLLLLGTVAVACAIPALDGRTEQEPKADIPTQSA